jgi:DNA-binding MarR family transcriptional regulator
LATLTTHRLVRALELIAQEVSGEVQVTTLLTLLFVAERGNCTQKDVEEGLKLTNATTSRNVSYWTDRRYDRAEGMNFIDRVPDDHDRRIRNLSLTPRGKLFHKRLLETNQ